MVDNGQPPELNAASRLSRNLTQAAWAEVGAASSYVDLRMIDRFMAHSVAALDVTRWLCEQCPCAESEATAALVFIKIQEMRELLK